ncbi:hypothetical protein BGX38DRAFT_1263663 [Terfezia claveryi]|nr:hypothetical protein BGX38DRAFT_1263663 [Terfezia claveryi]
MHLEEEGIEGGEGSHSLVMVGRLDRRRTAVMAGDGDGDLGLGVVDPDEEAYDDTASMKAASLSAPGRSGRSTRQRSLSAAGVENIACAPWRLQFGGLGRRSGCGVRLRRGHETVIVLVLRPGHEPARAEPGGRLEPARGFTKELEPARALRKEARADSSRQDSSRLARIASHRANCMVGYAGN